MEFQLASGGTSSVLIDASQVLRTHQTMCEVADLLESWVQYRVEPEVVAGPALGAEPIAAALTARIEGLRWAAVRTEPKSRGRDQGRITGPLRRGDRVLVVEDVLTTGASLRHAVDACRSAGGLVVGVFALVSRLDEPDLTALARGYEREEPISWRFIPWSSLFGRARS